LTFPIHPLPAANIPYLAIIRATFFCPFSLPFLEPIVAGQAAASVLSFVFSSSVHHGTLQVCHHDFQGAQE
jgi:hypothetical protein